ncbi:MULTISPECIES: histidine kinase [unclassified Streptococcus]|uniref:sensor histidine kinase n=1 Tax=unclassified Streptococcus TaxID=2608887 RepID=UPI000A752B0A|nr:MULTISPECIES: histidine kinase [unclassified Streptococcus]
MRKKELVPFKDKLRGEIFTGLRHLSFLIGLSYLLILSLFVITTHYTQFVQGRLDIRNGFKTVHTKSERVLKHLEEADVPAFLTQTLSERDMYRRAYEEKNRLPFDASLSIYSPDFQRIFSTRQPSPDGLPDDSFVKIVLPTVEEQAVNKVTSDHRGNRYLFEILPVLEGNKLLAYLVLCMDAKDLEASLDSESLHFLLADRFDNYLTANNTRYLTKDQRKVDTHYFSSFFLLQSGNLYMTSKEELVENIWLYSSILTVPVMPLFIFAISVSLLMIWMLSRAAKRLSQNISLHSSDAVEVLVEELNLIVKGYQTQLSITTDDEFGYLARKMNGVMETLQRIFQQSLRLEQEKTQYQRQLLEAQFNPHFLYNSLESLKILMTVDVKKAEQMILAMNRVLRYSVAHYKEFSTVEEDFEILEDFLKQHSF